MRFTEGIWQEAAGLKLHRAHSLWRYEADTGSARFMVPCHEIRTMADTTLGPALHFCFSSPAPDMLRVHIDHFTGGVQRGPAFTLYGETAPLLVEETDETVTLRSGRMAAVVRKQGLFGFDFFFDGKRLTGSGGRGSAYITDVDYEADLRQDYNGRQPVPYRSQVWLHEQLALDVGEYIYGMGERFTSLVRNGQSVDIWNRDGGSGCEQSYKNIPFYLSSKSYGVLVNTPAKVEFEVGTVSTRAVEFSVEGEALDYIVLAAESPKAVLARYTGLTGRSPVPPAWSFGLWLSSSWMPDSDEKITMEFINGMQERGIPLSVFHFDARWMDDFNDCDFVWSKRFGSDPRVLLQKIHDAGVKVCVWINPYVSQESRLFREGLEGGYFLKKPDGSVWQTDVWMSGMAIVDFTNPEAARWYAGRLAEIVDMGVDCIKTDFGERLPTNVVWHDGSDPHKMHNYYPYLYNQTIYGMLREKRGDAEACVFSRSSTVGTQQFPINWGGDNDSTYISMLESLRGGLSFCQSGFGFWAHDISGFENTATPDLYKRWSAFGLLSTHSRLHGQVSYRVPWAFDDESSDVLRFFARLKCRLMPYLYGEAHKVHLQGTPMMQAMMLAFPEDRNCLPLETQYMLGDDLLVAPIFNERGEAEFYLPAGGKWTHYLDGEVLEGGKWYKRSYSYFSLPLLARPGALIATGAVEDTPVYDYAEDLCLQLFQPVEGSPSRCVVYTTGGEKALEVTATLEGSTLTVHAEGHARWRLQLMGTRHAGNLQGATAQDAEKGLVLLPEGASFSLTL